MSRRDDIAATRLELDRLKDDQLALARFRRKQEKMVEKLFKVILNARACLPLDSHGLLVPGSWQEINWRSEITVEA